MKLRRLIIKSFRNLVNVDIPISDWTILIGENNSGKTALLDALRIALTRSGGRGIPFDDYDYHMAKNNDSPRTCEGILIELWFREDNSTEWPDSLIQDLTDIIQTDPVYDIDSVGLRISCGYDEIEKRFVPRAEFLNNKGQPLGGRGANPANIPKFLSYVRLFYMPAIRDAGDEFSTRSQYWGRILKDLNISDEHGKQLNEELSKLNNALLKADPRLEEVKQSLDNIQKVIMVGAGQKTSIQALPLRPWDLMSKSQVVIQAAGGTAEFPLLKHGQGVQSLAVLFLFRAYIEIFLKPAFRPETEAILCLEEPEAHLHPQAARALADYVHTLPAQVIASTHSPYFLQEIPFTEIRMLRKSGAEAKALYVKRTFAANVPDTTLITEFCGKDPTKFQYDRSDQLLKVSGRLMQDEYRDLLKIYIKDRTVHSKLKALYVESQNYLSNEDLIDLETYAKRIRGEILFARGWLLCEGQSEYLVMRYFAELMGTPLDPLGITVIDFQNNGSPGAFVALARAFEIPWLMVCDNDQAGKSFKNQIKNRGLQDEEVDKLVKPLPGEGMDFERFILRNGFSNEMKALLEEPAKLSAPDASEWTIAVQSIDQGKEMRNMILLSDGSYKIQIRRTDGKSGMIDSQNPKFSTIFEDIIVSQLQRDKVRHANGLITRLRVQGADRTRVPAFYRETIQEVISRSV